MMKVSNGKTIRRLGWRSMKAARTRNLIAVLAIALTTVLFTSLFTIAMSINDGFQQSNFRQVGGFSHGGFKYLTEEQFNNLKDDPLIDQWGMRRFIGMPTEVPFNKSHVEVSYADANEAHWMYCDPVEGRLPQEGTDEAATDTHVLELLGVEPEIGARFTISFDVDGHTTTQTFTLCGWWEYDEAIVANHILIPESRADAILDEVGTVPPGEDGMTGSWNLDVMLKSGSRHIANDIAQILENHGYQDQSAGAPDYIHTGVNWGYTGAQLSDNLDPSVVIAVAAMLLLIIFTGYLIIYNVFQISVTNDIRFYGLLKTIGTTPRQLRRIIRQQALTLALQRRAALSHGGGKLQLAGLQPPDLVEREAEIPQQRDAQQRLQILLAVVAVFILPPRGSEQPLLLVVADVRARQAAALFDLFDVHRLSFRALRRSFPML